ncbi:MAG TPA: hypothetical protein VJ840_18710 [Gemmatimonadaceae bacterium]|nr:hypothetical protein [Gemmatimonadaceae bacterium]
MKHSEPEPIELRGTGRTKQQLIHAPPHAFFMVSNAAMLEYTKRLAIEVLHRTDLQFIINHPGWDNKVLSQRCKIVVDHHTASELDGHDMAMIAELNLRPGLEK